MTQRHRVFSTTSVSVAKTLGSMAKTSVFTMEMIAVLIKRTGCVSYRIGRDPLPTGSVPTPIVGGLFPIFCVFETTVGTSNSIGFVLNPIGNELNPIGNA